MSSVASLTLLEEKSREAEYEFIEFRDSSVGRFVYMKGSRLSVWWVIHVAKQCEMTVVQLATHFNRPIVWVKAAFEYYSAFPTEIDLSIEDHKAADYASLKRAIPSTEWMVVLLDADQT